jgi:hypothetical protein
MLVPMVQVGDVRVSVAQRCMRMDMAVCFTSQVIVFVVFVVDVGVVVRQRLMVVCVNVVLEEQRGHAADHQGCCRGLT